MCLAWETHMIYHAIIIRDINGCYRTLRDFAGFIGVLLIQRYILIQ